MAACSECVRLRRIVTDQDESLRRIRFQLRINLWLFVAIASLTAAGLVLGEGS